MRYRVPIRTLAGRCWSGRWEWFTVVVKGRKRLGLRTTGGHEWIFKQDAGGCWLEKTET
jgi:hypothetical protein